MKPRAIIEKLRMDGVELYLNESKLCFRAYHGLLSAENRELITAHRSSLISMLNGSEIISDILPGQCSKELSSDDFQKIVALFGLLARERDYKKVVLDVQVEGSNHIHVAS